MMFDPLDFGPSRNATARQRRRMANIVSVQTGYTATIQFAGDTSTITGVRYLSHVVPEAGSVVLVDTDGLDMVIVGAVAGNGGATAACYANLTAASQNVTNGYGTTKIVFTATNDPHGLLVSSTKFTAKMDGFYSASFWLTYAAFAGGHREVSIKLNDSAYMARQYVTAINGTSPHEISCSSGPIPMSVGDYIECVAGQTVTSGGLGVGVARGGFTYLGPAA